MTTPQSADEMAEWYYVWWIIKATMTIY